MKYLLALLLLLPNIASAAFSVPMVATSTTQGWAMPSRVNGIEQTLVSQNFIGTSSSLTSFFPLASTTYASASSGLTVNGVINLFGTNSTAVTGTGNIVLSASPALTGTATFVNLSGTLVTSSNGIRGGTASTNYLPLRGTTSSALSGIGGAIVFLPSGQATTTTFTGLGAGFGTTTPQWPVTSSTSTKPQLALTDGSLTSDIWTWRNINGNFYMATASPSTFATSTTAALTIDTSGVVSVNTASTTNLNISGITNPCSGTSALTTSASGAVSCATLSFDTFAWPFTPATNYGVTMSATTTGLWGQAGVYASSTTAYPTLGVQQLGAGAAATFMGGNVGIGTTTPATLLHVQGIGGGGFTGTTNSNNLAIFAKTAASNSVAAIGVVGGSAGVAYITLGGDGASTFDDGRVSYDASLNALGLWTSNSQKMTVTSGGNVGISTTTPDAPFDVIGIDGTLRSWAALQRTVGIFENYSASASRPAIVSIISGSANKARLTFGDESGQSQGSIDYDNTNDSLAVSTNASTALTINSSGNVGIGTTTPARLLNLTNTGATGQLLLEDSGASANQHYWGLASSRGSFAINSMNDALASTTRIYINSSGNVGIATTSPSQVLSVQGNGLISGTLTAALYYASSTDTVTTPGFSWGGDADTGMWHPAANQLAFSTSGSEWLRIDSSGRLLASTTVSRQVGAAVENFQQETTGVGAGASYVRNSNDTTGSFVTLGKSRSTAIGGVTTVASGDVLSRITAAGADGTDLTNLASDIRTTVDNTVSTGIVPGRVSIFTTNTSGTLTEALRVDSTQHVVIGAGTTPSSVFDILGNNYSATPSGAGQQMRLRAQTFTDSGTAAGANVAAVHEASIAQFTLAATNAIGSTTLASNLSIGAAPIASTNEVIMQSAGLNIAGGTSCTGAGTCYTATGLRAVQQTGASGVNAAGVFVNVNNTAATPQIRLVADRQAVTSGEFLAGIDFATDDTDLTASLMGSTTASIYALASEAHTAATWGTNLIFGTTAAGGTATNTEKMRLTGAGNLGLGTTTPNWLFQQAGIRPFQVISDTSAGVDAKHWFQASEGGNFYIGTSSDTFATTTYLTILNGGFLGIGTTTPSKTLSVAGNAIVSGSFTLGRNTTSSTTLSYTATYDPASLAAATQRTDTVTVTGITLGGGAVVASPGTAPAARCVIAAVRASAADTVSVTWQNVDFGVGGSACDTGSSTWVFTQNQ